MIQKMCISFHYIILFFILLLILYYFYKNQNNEHFGLYKRNPYDNYDVGQTPFNFYEFPIYRKPYMYPQQFYKSYPVPNLSYFEDSLTLH